MLLQFDKNLKKAYILIITCSLSRAVHKVKNWKNSLRFKRFVARRGRPQKVYSDNAKTFKAAADWVKAIIKSERFQDYLSESCIKWQFNLLRAPWWGRSVRTYGRINETVSLQVCWESKPEMERT